jgi:hypothetical protein
MGRSSSPRAVLVGRPMAQPMPGGRQTKKSPMNAPSTFSPRFAPLSERESKTLSRLVNRQTVQRIASTVSLISQAVGFFGVGMLIMVNRHQSDLNGLSSGSSVAMAGGIGAIFVGTVFLVAAACYYCRFCTKRSAASSASRQTYATTSFSAQGDNPRNRSLLLSLRLLPG